MKTCSVVRDVSFLDGSDQQEEPTLLQPGNSHACTRFPFLALLILCVVGVYVMGKGMSPMMFGVLRVLLSAGARLVIG